MLEWKKLGDVCEIKGRIGFRGYTRDDQVIKGEGAISLSPGNISDGVLCYDTCTYITWSKYEESPEIMVQDGDIILCKTASVGKVARVKHLPEKATINPQLVLIKNIVINPQFLYYVLADNPFQSRIKGLAGVGSVPNVSQAKLASISIPVPSIAEQTRIVGILDTFTASIENLKQQIAQRHKQYEHYRDQLLDLEGKEGVEMKTLGEICIIKNGYTPSTKNPDFWNNGSLPWFTLEDIRKNGRVLVDAIKHITPSGVKKGGLFPKDSIIVSTTATIGEYAIIKTDFLCNQQITCLSIKEICKKQLLPKFLYYLADGIGKWCKQNVNGGGSLLIVSTSKLQKKPIPVPSLQDQSRIVSILDSFEASIANLEQQLAQRERQYEYYRNKLLTFE